MNSGIYVILNLINDKFYVGSAKNFYKRWHTHKSMLVNNYHDNSYLQNAWNKYKQLNFIFVIMEYCELDRLIEREQFYIDSYKPAYNLRPRAESMLGFVHSDKAREKNRQSHLNKKASDEAKRNMSEASPYRDKEKWPHEKGAKCQCEECKLKRKERDKVRNRQWKIDNREHYNKYMREQRKVRILRKLANSSPNDQLD